MSREEIKPCPACGGDARLLEIFTKTLSYWRLIMSRIPMSLDEIFVVGISFAMLWVLGAVAILWCYKYAKSKTSKYEGKSDDQKDWKLPKQSYDWQGKNLTKEEKLLLLNIINKSRQGTAQQRMDIWLKINGRVKTREVEDE